MAGKLTTLMLSKKNSRWVILIKPFSSVSGQNYPETHQKILIRTEIDPKIHFLKNNLSPINLIRILDSTHDLYSALKVFKWASLQRKFRHTVSTYSSIILKLGFAGNVDEVEGFTREMVKDKCRGVNEALGGLIDVFVRNGRFDEAMRVMLVMNFSGINLSIGKWNCLLSALVEGKRGFRDVLLVYKEMVKSGTLPNVDVLNNLIKSLFDANMADKALDQYRRMKKKRCMPNCRTFETVIDGLVASGLVDESLCVVNEMFKDRVNPDVRFCNKVIPLFCKENKLEQATQLYNMMQRLQIVSDNCTYAALIKCLCMNLRISEAIELFHNARNCGFSVLTDVLVNLVNACCEVGNLEEAKNLLDVSQVLDPSPYNLLLQGYCDAHRFLAAKNLLQGMVLMCLADNLSWNIFIQGLCRAKYVKQALEVLAKMIISSHLPDSSTYSALIVGKCKMGDCKNTMKLYQHVVENDWILDSYSYTELITGLCELDRFQEAYKVFVYMSARKSTLHASLFSCLIKGFCETARADDAIRLLMFGQTHGNPVNTSAYTSILHCSLKQNRPYNALVFFPQILKRGLALDTEVYFILIQCMVAACQTRYCVLFLNLMVSEGLIPDSETLASLLPYLAEHSKLHTIWMSIDILCQESHVIDSDISNLLINGLSKEGFKSEACRLLDYMLEKGWLPNASTHRLLTGTLRDTEPQTVEPDASVIQDEVSCILSAGLGGT